MVTDHLNANYIFTKPMKNRTEGEMVRVYQKLINQMQAAGLGVKKQVLNNKCSAAMKECIKHNNIEYELVPPGQHRQNQAEQAIKTFKAFPSWPGSATSSPFPFGATFSNQPN